MISFLKTHWRSWTGPLLLGAGLIAITSILLTSSSSPAGTPDTIVLPGPEESSVVTTRTVATTTSLPLPVMDRIATDFALANGTTTVFRMEYEAWGSSIELAFSVTADGYFEWTNIEYFDDKPMHLIGNIPSGSIGDLIDEIETAEPSLGGADAPVLTFLWVDRNGQEKMKQYFLTYRPLVTSPPLGFTPPYVPLPLMETIVRLAETYGWTP